MIDIMPKKPFGVQYQFIGNIFKNGLKSKDLHFVIEYSKINGGAVSGHIVGTDIDAKDLCQITDLPSVYAKLISKQDNYSQKLIKSDKAIVKTIRQSIRPKDYEQGRQLTNVFADIIFEDLTIEEEIPKSINNERNLLFYLAGPRKMWDVAMMRSTKDRGQTDCQTSETKIELDEKHPFIIEVYPQFHYENGENKNIETTTTVMVLHLKTTESIQSLSDDDLVSQGKKLVEDLILLTSLLSKKWIVWYQYDFYTNGVSKRYVKSVNSVSSEEINYHSALIEQHNAKEFIRKALSGLYKLHDANFDLKMPIVYYINGNEARYVEEQFANYFLSLERIKDMYMENNQDKIQIGEVKKGYSRLKKGIKQLIDEEIESEDIQNLIKGKLVELSRPSLRHVLNILFAEYKIDYKSLYPKDAKNDFIDTRNHLFHSAKSYEAEYLVKETRRIQAVLERLFLKMFEWNDISWSPNGYTHRWLTQ